MQGLLIIAQAVIFLAACLVYCNSLHGEFAFDDHMAILKNKDVINQTAPIMNLLRNDFWGQEMTSVKSHKSYRPLTVLVFRAIASLAMDGINQEEMNPDDEIKMGPFLFHIANVVLHGVVSVLVFRCGEVDKDMK